MLSSKTILITGACGLIGKSFVKGLLEHNSKIIIADIDDEALSHFSEELKKDFKAELIETVNLDITNEERIVTFFEKFHQENGPITTLVNNAYPRNKNYGRHLFDVEYKDFCENLGLNLGGYFLMCQKYSKYAKEKNIPGNIINISSIYGVIPPKFEVYDETEMTMPVEYAVIKSGLIHLTKYLAKYLKGTSIRVNALSPGGILNGQNQKFVEQYNTFSTSKGMLDPSDLFGALRFLISDESRFVNGQNIIVDDGFTL